MTTLGWGVVVEKFSGDYGGPGEIVGAVDWDGKRRYLVAFKIEGGFGRFIHVLNESQIRPIEPAGSLAVSPSQRTD